MVSLIGAAFHDGFDQGNQNALLAPSDFSAMQGLEDCDRISAANNLLSRRDIQKRIESGRIG
jgi:hypothetical protein